MTSRRLLLEPCCCGSQSRAPGEVRGQGARREQLVHIASSVCSVCIQADGLWPLFLWHQHPGPIRSPGSRPQVNDAIDRDAFYLLTIIIIVTEQSRKEGWVKVPGAGAAPQMSSPHSCPAHIEGHRDRGSHPGSAPPPRPTVSLPASWPGLSHPRGSRALCPVQCGLGGLNGYHILSVSRS